MTTQTFFGTLTVIQCCTCGMPFGMTSDYTRRRREDGQGFYCPSGHSQSFVDSEVQRLQKEIERQKEARARAEAREARAHERARTAERSRAAIRGILGRTTKRVAAGVCPCCSRSFENLGRHMQGKHPNYVKEHEEART